MFTAAPKKSGRPRFGSVRLRFGGGTVPAGPVFGSGGSSAQVVFLCFSTVQQGGTVPVPVLVPGKGFWRFRFRFRFWEKRFRRFRFPVPVRFLSHPEKCPATEIRIIFPPPTPTADFTF